jgi:hypothetical protein
MMKYADDMNLLIGSNNADSIGNEMQHVSEWAKNNNLRLNESKSAQIVFGRRKSGSSLPLAPGIPRVDSLKLLGVTLQSNLRFDEHISDVIASCASSMYALRMLRSHGLPSDALHEVCRATTISRLLYASPAWWGFTNAADKERFEVFIRKTKKCDYLPENFPTVATLCDKADTVLFKALRSDNQHVLHKLLPQTVSHGYNLRDRSHNYELPTKDINNFIPRMLYRNIY